MTRVVWTEPAIADLAAIIEYVERDSPPYAQAITEQIFAAVDRVAEFPRSGRLIPEVQKASLREVLVGAYRVMYRVSDRQIEVLTIVHAARQFSRKRLRRR